jgi:prepilin-type N-terminal cleavage/methylation domain-containing protein
VVQARHRTEGFTLLEILLVVFLIGVLTYAFAQGRFSSLSFAIQESTDTLEAELRYASERAVATGETHRLLFDLEEQRFRLEHEVDAGPGADEPALTAAGRLSLEPPLPSRRVEPVPTLKGQWRRLETKEVLIARVRVGNEVFEREGVAIGFGSDGSADDAVVELEDIEGQRRFLAVAPFTSEVQVLYGEDGAAPQG